MKIINLQKLITVIETKTLKVLKRSFKSEYSFVVKVGSETVTYSESWISDARRDDSLREFKEMVGA